MTLSSIEELELQQIETFVKMCSDRFVVDSVDTVLETEISRFIPITNKEEYEAFLTDFILHDYRNDTSLSVGAMYPAAYHVTALYMMGLELLGDGKICHEFSSANSLRTPCYSIYMDESMYKTRIDFYLNLRCVSGHRYTVHGITVHFKGKKLTLKPYEGTNGGSHFVNYTEGAESWYETVKFLAHERGVYLSR